MSILMYAINRIKQHIPYEVLHAAVMMNESSVTANLTSMDDKILNKVLRPSVLLDANIVGGIEMIVPLNNVPPLYYEDFYTVYHVDKDLTMGREIVSALGMTAMPVNMGFGNPVSQSGGFGLPTQNNMAYSNSFNPLMGVANRIGDAASISGLIHNAHLELVGPNTILINQHYRILANLGVRVIIENENNLNNISRRSWQQFAELCTLYTKSFVYNTLIIPINSGALVGGQDLGIFKSIIESYDSAMEDYLTYLNEVWARVAYMNDNGRYNRLLSSMIAPDL